MRQLPVNVIICIVCFAVQRNRCGVVLRRLLSAPGAAELFVALTTQSVTRAQNSFLFRGHSYLVRGELKVLNRERQLGHRLVKIPVVVRRLGSGQVRNEALIAWNRRAIVVREVTVTIKFLI